jgi:CubicO group peptidase (beta-lactamase class C family)
MNGSVEARRVLEEAIRARVFPAATAEVGNSTGSLWKDALGTLTFEADAAHTRIDTPFDLASLTKVIATATAMMDAVSSGALALGARAAEFLDEWRGEDRDTVSIRDLLEHASGLPARLPDAPPEGRREVEHEICSVKLDYQPRARSVYSDLGFILLGFIAEDLGRDVATTVAAIGLGSDVTFDLPPDRRRHAAPTMPLGDDVRRGRQLIGEVHDNYAAALGGVAGHAGLFGTAAGVGAFARAILRAARGDGNGPFSTEAVAQFTTKSAVPGSSRALGWDTMLPTSSCGTKMSAAAFGHVGFTGTSLWIDPARDRYFVLLTNRVCGGGTLDQMREVRRAFHDALA